MKSFRQYSLILILLFQVSTVFCNNLNDSIIIGNIIITGNKVSKERIILKELNFNIGDTIAKSDVIDFYLKSRENLLNTSLFNFVNIYHIPSNGQFVDVIISVIERWYIWPSPIFEHAERNLGAFIHNPNWNRINYGGQINWNNFRGRNEFLKLKLRFGYKEVIELLYDKPNFGKNQQHGLTISVNRSRQHEVNLMTVNNKPVYLKNENTVLLEFFNPYITYTYRQALYTRHSFSISYLSINFRDSVNHENYTGLKYRETPEFIYGFYSFEYDFRDSKSYPLEGDYIRLGLQQRNSLNNNFDFNGGFLFLMTATHHRLIKNRFYYNNALRLQLSKDEYDPKSYRTGPGIGPYMRGYELYVIEGNSHAILMDNLKYAILKPTSYNLKYIPWSQFNPIHLSIYANLFFDLSYVKGDYYSLNGNTYVNRLLYTGGLGIDFVSYYDQVLRFELSINREGKPGFFIHTEVPFGRW